MRTKNTFLVASLIFLGLAFFSPHVAMAQDATTASDLVASTDDSSVNDLEPLEGVTVDEEKSMPSGFGLWWRNLRETVSIGLTFDPVKKAEKQLQFAEERARLANYIIQNSTAPEVQEKAQAMLEKANGYMQKIEERKEDLIRKGDERSQKLLNNIAKHNLNKERILEAMEDKIPAEKVAEFQQLRKAIEEKHRNFLSQLQDNPNVSQEIKDNVENVLSQVEDMQEVRDQFRDQQKNILEAIKAGNKGAKEQFEKMREEKKQSIERLKEQFKSQREELKNTIKEGDKSAVPALKQLNREQQEEAAKIRQEMQKKTGEIKMEAQKNREEELKKLNELNRERQKKADEMRGEIRKKAEEIRNEMQEEKQENREQSQGTNPSGMSQ